MSHAFNFDDDTDRVYRGEVFNGDADTEPLDHDGEEDEEFEARFERQLQEEER